MNYYFKKIPFDQNNRRAFTFMEVITALVIVTVISFGVLVVINRGVAAMLEGQARAAAFEDPRFDSVSRNELQSLSVEISVLTPFVLVEDPGVVEVGRHGLLVEKGLNRGVLLPQVAVEQGWSAEEFLSNVCIKASLPPDAWKDPGARLYTFSALVIESVSG